MQNRAARFVSGNYNFETGSTTKILEQLKWESLQQRQKDSRLILFYKGLKVQASIPVDDLKTPLRHARNHHSEPFQVPYARTYAYRHSFFPETIRDWNALPASTISPAEGSEDCVSRFTSLMRSSDQSSFVDPGECTCMSVNVSPVSYFDSDSELLVKECALSTG